MSANKRIPLGWAKEKIGRQLVSREFISKREMKEALAKFEEHRGILPVTYSNYNKKEKTVK